MRKLIALLFLAGSLFAQNPETGQFPTPVTDEYLGVVANEFLEFTTLSAGIDDTTTTIPFTDASGYPEYTIVRIGNEILHCTTKSVNNFTCARGQQGSTAAAHFEDDIIRIPLTARSLNRITAELKALAANLPALIGGGASALATDEIASEACDVTTVSATGVATTDVILASHNGTPVAVTGYIPSAGGTLYIRPYPTADNINFLVCNNGPDPVTPGAITLNWMALRVP